MQVAQHASVLQQRLQRALLPGMRPAVSPCTAAAGRSARAALPATSSGLMRASRREIDLKAGTSACRNPTSLQSLWTSIFDRGWREYQVLCDNVEPYATLNMDNPEDTTIQGETLQAASQEEVSLQTETSNGRCGHKG